MENAKVYFFINQIGTIIYSPPQKINDTSFADFQRVNNPITCKERLMIFFKYMIYKEILNFA